METDSTNLNYRDYLSREFASRSKRNPSYSLRAFARDLNMQPSKLSEVLRDKCGISPTAARNIAKNLRLNETEAEHFVALVEARHGRSETRRRQARELLQSFARAWGYTEIDLEKFKVISDWVHFAILELTDVDDFESDASWIAKRLDVDVETVEAALKRLFQFGLLRENEQGVWVQATGDLATPTDIPSREIRDHHTQILHKAMRGLDEYAVIERDYSTSLMSIASDQIDEAKRVLKAFRREFAQRFQEKAGKDRVYCLAYQFFPVDKAHGKRSQR